mmetsp:Transcript_24520/g.61725  ORF Transcript_24520/g.61725 Transcript_24520/m.61725 type:complete len:387 (+) Transcript_24520:191-1351(+)
MHTYSRKQRLAAESTISCKRHHHCISAHSCIKAGISLQPSIFAGTTRPLQSVAELRHVFHRVVFSCVFVIRRHCSAECSWVVLALVFPVVAHPERHPLFQRNVLQAPLSHFEVGVRRHVGPIAAAVPRVRHEEIVQPRHGLAVLLPPVRRDRVRRRRCAEQAHRRLPLRLLSARDVGAVVPPQRVVRQPVRAQDSEVLLLGLVGDAAHHLVEGHDFRDVGAGEALRQALRIGHQVAHVGVRTGNPLVVPPGPVLELLHRHARDVLHGGDPAAAVRRVLARHVRACVALGPVRTLELALAPVDSGRAAEMTRGRIGVGIKGSRGWGGGWRRRFTSERGCSWRGGKDMVGRRRSPQPLEKHTRSCVWRAVSTFEPRSLRRIAALWHHS